MSWLGSVRSLRLRDRLVRIQEVGGSKPLAPTTLSLLSSIIYATFADPVFWTAGIVFCAETERAHSRDTGDMIECPVDSAEGCGVSEYL
jgi:hypothetical protein